MVPVLVAAIDGVSLQMEGGQTGDGAVLIGVDDMVPASVARVKQEWPFQINFISKYLLIWVWMGKIWRGIIKL